MAILRKQRRGQYTVIDNAIFKDRELSNKALGMLCRMLSLPDGWEFSVEGLSTLSTDGVSAVRSQLSELEECGYLKRNYIRENGKVSGIEYVVSEEKMCDFPKSENDISEKPISENRPQSITKESITHISSSLRSEDTESKTKGVSSSLRSEDIYTEFENLWAIYPKKQGKDKAFGYYQKARKNGTTYEEVGNGIAAYRRYVENNRIDMQYVKMGSTFFSQKSWQDDWDIINGSREETREEFFARLIRENGDDV